MNRPPALLGYVLLALASAACDDRSLISDPFEGDADTDASPASGSWSCLEQGSIAPTSARITVTLTAFNAVDLVTFAGEVDSGSDLALVTDTPFPALSVVACAAVDAACASPVATGTTDANGLASLVVTDSFAGSFHLTGGDAGSVVPTTLWLGSLPAGSTTFGAPVPILETQGLSAIEAALDTSPSESLGHVFFEVYDCSDELAAGVSVAPSTSLGTEAVAWYASNKSLPDATLTQTSATGTGGILNAAPGAVSLAATIPGSSTVIGSASVVVAPQAITNVLFRARAH